MEESKNNQGKNGGLGLGVKTKGLGNWVKKWWLFFVIGLVWICAMQYIVSEKYDAAVRVADQAGDSSRITSVGGLDFGILSHDSSATRFITVRNGSDYDVYVKIYKLGEIGKYVKLNRDGFILSPDESENLEFTISIPEGAAEKAYAGKIIIFEVPKIL